MAKLILNAGLANNDKTGDTLRAGALKIKSNFEEIYTALASDGSIISGGNVLKTGSYSDLSNKPIFSSVAVSGNFYDLGDRPDLGILVGEPPNETGTDGNVFGNMAYADGSFYFCFEDYVQQLSFTGLNALNDNSYHLNITWLAGYQALLDAFENSMALSVNPGTDGNWRNITAISKNTGTNKLSITYEGSNFAATTGITVKINQPQIWKSIPWSPDYSNPFPGISTGNWTWPEISGGTQALLGGESGSYIDGQSPGGLLIHSDNTVTLQAGDKGLSYNDTGILQFQEGSTITETATTLILTPPTALTGQGLVIRPTAGNMVFNNSGFIVAGETLSIFLESSQIGTASQEAFTYEITGATAEQLGLASLIGEFAQANWIEIDSSTGYNEITIPIPSGSNATTLTLTITDTSVYHNVAAYTFANNPFTVTGDGVSGIENSHIHLLAGDPITVDLYLGDDDQYVKIEKDGGDVVIGTNANTKRWRFDNNGALTFPTLSTNLHNGGIQTAQTLQFGGANQQVVITGPTPDVNASAERLIIQGQRGLGTGEGGDVYLWAGDAEGINAGDIKIYAGDADDVTAGYGGYVNIDGGRGFTQGGHVEITAGQSDTHGGNLNLNAGYGTTSGGNLSLSAGNSANTNGVVQVYTSGHQWVFTADGQFTLPAGGNVVLSTGAPAFVYISVLKQLVSDSTDFADFQSRIAAL